MPVLNDRFEVATVPIRNGAVVDFRTKDGTTILMIVAARGNVRIGQTVCWRMALMSMRRDHSSSTALWLPAGTGKIHSTLLLEKKADTGSKDEKWRDRIDTCHPDRKKHHRRSVKDSITRPYRKKGPSRKKGTTDGRSLWNLLWQQRRLLIVTARTPA